MMEKKGVTLFADGGGEGGCDCFAPDLILVKGKICCFSTIFQIDRRADFDVVPNSFL